MINCGVKVGVSDWRQKLLLEPDFVEISYKSNIGFEAYGELLYELSKKELPFYVHLSTSYEKNEDEILLNLASADKETRAESRKIITDELSYFNKYSHNGYIAHIPTAYDFSRKSLLSNKKATITDFQDALSWIRTQEKNILLETATAAIQVNETVSLTEPFDQSFVFKQKIPCVLDTGHFSTHYTDEPLQLEDALRNMFNYFSYYHIATLKKLAAYDNHGSIFNTENIETPNKKLLGSLIESRMTKSIIHQIPVYFVCEPQGDISSHEANLRYLQSLKQTVILQQNKD